MDKLHVLLQIAVMALVTAALRFLPFLVFQDQDKRPGVILSLIHI